MARFQAYQNQDGPGYLLDVQADLLDHLNTRVVVPLLPLETLRAARQLNPIFEIEGANYTMATQFMAAVPLTALGPARADLSAGQATIISALDFLFSGV